jgi:hypothetical protein
VKVAPRKPELLELAEHFAEMLDRHDSAFARAAVLITVCACCIASIGQQDPRRFPLGGLSPPKLLHHGYVQIGKGFFHFTGLQWKRLVGAV